MNRLSSKAVFYFLFILDELAYTGLSHEMLDKYIKDSQDLYGDRKLYISQIGPTIGTHIGPGAIGVAFFKNK